MNWRNHIEQKPGVACGKPVLKDTRLTVEFVLERLAAGEEPAKLPELFPPLTDVQVRAVLAYAAARVGREVLVESA